MAHIQVLLVKPVRNLGNEGEAVKVKAGFARNYLFPQGIAMPVNRSTKRQLEVLAKRREERMAKELTEAKTLAEKLSAFTLSIKVKTSEEGKMHGAVNNMEVLKGLIAAGFALERHHVRLSEPLKALGTHEVTIKLHPEVAVELKVSLESETPLPEKKDESKKKAKKASKEEAPEAEATEEAPAATEEPKKKSKKTVKHAE